MDHCAPNTTTRQAILDRFKTIGAEAGQPISIYEIGTALDPAGYTQEDLMNALFDLHNEQFIDLIDGNKFKVNVQ